MCAPNLKLETPTPMFGLVWVERLIGKDAEIPCKFVISRSTFCFAKLTKNLTSSGFYSKDPEASSKLTKILALWPLTLMPTSLRVSSLRGRILPLSTI